MHAAVHEAKAQAIFISAIQLAESLETIRPGGWDVDYWIDHQDVIAFECQAAGLDDRRRVGERDGVQAGRGAQRVIGVRPQFVAT